jgi:hypothetical protein
MNQEVADEPAVLSLTRLKALPPRSMVGQLTLDQHIGVRIPGGQPRLESKAVHRSTVASEAVHARAIANHSL